MGKNGKGCVFLPDFFNLYNKVILRELEILPAFTISLKILEARERMPRPTCCSNNKTTRRMSSLFGTTLGRINISLKILETQQRMPIHRKIDGSLSLSFMHMHTETFIQFSCNFYMFFYLIFSCWTFWKLIC